MIEILDYMEQFSGVNKKYNDTWMLTFYFIAALAILIGLFWTIYKKNKYDKKNKLNENTIYNKSYDAIENMDAEPKRKENMNYYDVYQNENKHDAIDNEEIEDNSISEKIDLTDESMNINNEEQIVIKKNKPKRNYQSYNNKSKRNTNRNNKYNKKY